MGATLVAHLPWVMLLISACGEPPFAGALCTRGAPIVPWYVLLLVAPSSALGFGIVARRRANRRLFEVVWISLVCLGVVAFLAPAIATRLG